MERLWSCLLLLCFCEAAIPAELLYTLSHPECPYCLPTVAFSPDGTTLMVDVCEKLRFHDSGTGKWRSTMDVGEHIMDFVCSPDGKNLALATFDDLRLWKMRGTKTSVLLDEGTKTCVSFSPNGRLVAAPHNSPNNERKICIWDITSKEISRELQGHQGMITSLAFSPSGKLLASAGGCDDSSVRLWETSTGRLRREWRYIPSWVGCLAFSPDGRSLVLGTKDNCTDAGQFIVLRLGGETTVTRRAHERRTTSVQFSPDGRILATASKDGTIKIWQTRDYKELRTLLHSHKGVTRIAISPDGKLLASSGYDGIVKVWGLQDIVKAESVNPGQSSAAGP